MTRLQVAAGRSRPTPVTGSGLLVCTPLRLEARAVRRGLRGAGQGTGQPAGQGRASGGAGQGRSRSW